MKLLSLCLALLGSCASGLQLGGAPNNAAVRRFVTEQPPRPAFTMRMSKEDQEFEEWVRKKKIASGVDPDEDFAAGRKTESSIFAVGGIVAVVVPVVAGLWAYNEGYLTPQ